MKYRKQEIPTPPEASEQLHKELVYKYTEHFSTILNEHLMIANRKECYAVVINAEHNGYTLEQLLGTINSRIATQEVLKNIQTSLFEVK